MKNTQRHTNTPTQPPLRPVLVQRGQSIDNSIPDRDQAIRRALAAAGYTVAAVGSFNRFIAKAA